jgi:hypothetical protein
MGQKAAGAWYGQEGMGGGAVPLGGGHVWRRWSIPGSTLPPAHPCERGLAGESPSSATRDGARGRRGHRCSSPCRYWVNAKVGGCKSARLASSRRSASGTVGGACAASAWVPSCCGAVVAAERCGGTPASVLRSTGADGERGIPDATASKRARSGSEALKLPSRGKVALWAVPAPSVAEGAIVSLALGAMAVCTVTPPWTSKPPCAPGAEGLLGATRALGAGASLVADAGASTHELPAFPLLLALTGRLDGVGHPAAAAVERLTQPSREPGSREKLSCFAALGRG